MSWSKECITSEISIVSRIPPNPDANPPVQEVGAVQTTSAIFQINNAKLYVPVVTLSINDNINFWENILQGLKRTISWNKYRFEITTQTKNSNLHYLIDPTFRTINRLFLVSFKNGNNDPTRNYFDKHYMPLVDSKDFKPFFDQPIKNKKEV